MELEIVYTGRSMSEAERQELLNWRQKMGLPLHAPPHYPEGLQTYLITAACYEHRPIMGEESRRAHFSGRLLDALSALGGTEIHAWVVLPNHYHVLATVDLALLKRALGRLHNGTATEWNRADGISGRQIWYRFSDRLVRSEAHYFASLNYVHANPMKHAYVSKAGDWHCCSLHDWMELYGREYLTRLWLTYPVRDYGRGWDD